MKNQDAVAHLASVTDKDFVELFYAAVAQRDAIDGENSRRFVLAETSEWPDGERDTVFLAVEDPSHYPVGWANDSPICQTGQCGECGADVRSIAKHAICPLCSKAVYCT